MVTIVIDGMGGDYAPAEIVKGAILAAQKSPETELILVGQREVLRSHLSSHPSLPNISIEKASEVIEMGEEVVRAIKAKTDSSIVVGAKMVGEGRADGFVSAGNTGAAMAAASLFIGRIKGISRPAIAIIVPTPRRPVLLLDGGANADCKPKNMLQFAQMAQAYMNRVLKVDDPQIGLLSIGEEENKGNELVQASHKLLSQSALNFIGNVEGRDIPAGKVDVVITDGFTGNVVLKVLEGLTGVLFTELSSVARRTLRGKLGGWFLLPSLKEIKRELDQEEYGGAQLLGIDGTCIICHGSSSCKAIKNAILLATQTVKEEIPQQIKKTLAEGDSE